MFREAVAHQRRRREASLDDDALLLQLAREILQGPSDEGRSSYQVAITTCDRCRQTYQECAGELIPLQAETVAMVACDAQPLGSASAGEGSSSMGHGSTCGTRDGMKWRRELRPPSMWVNPA